MKSDKESLPDWKKDWDRAKDFFMATENNLKLEDLKTAANRAYFTAESAVKAALKFNSCPVSKNHKNIWVYSKLLDLGIDSYNLLRELYDLRLQADYGHASEIVELNKNNLDKFLIQIKCLLDTIKAKYKFDSKIRVILASKSQRRKEILEEQGYDVIVDVSNIDEDSVKRKDVKELVMELARLKAEAVKERHKSEIIVAADTLVYFYGKEIGQQKNDDEAKETIKMLIGKTHEVYSGVCVINTSNGKIEQGYEVSKVKLKNVSENTLKKYIKSGQYRGKAGAYNIADPEFESFVENVEGCKFNIMGLPIEKVKMMINKVL